MVEQESLDHGLFQFTFPKDWIRITAWFIGAILLGVTATLYLISLGVPDIPPVSEAIRAHPTELGEEDEFLLGDGFEDGEKGVYLVIDVWILNGVVAEGHCYQDDDGNWHSSVSAENHGTVGVNPLGSAGFHVNWYPHLDPEINAVDRNCPQGDWTIGTGDRVEMFILKQGDDLWLLSVGEGNLPAEEKTGREDVQRWALASMVIGSMTMMIATPTSLSEDIKRLRGERMDKAPVHGKPGALEFGSGPHRESDAFDWVLTEPLHVDWPDDPYAPDPDEELIAEHPIKIGTPIPATFTLYSINGILFITSSLWLSSDLLARHGTDLHWWIGNILRFGILIFNIAWAYLAYKKWKLLHNVIDTPTSRVRSVAVGAAEIVGQVRPGPRGTMSFNVADDASRHVDGAVAYSWKEEEYVCRGSGKDRKCSWETRRTDSGSIEFMLHDGTGGIMIEPQSWSDVDHGPMLHRWGGGKWRWTVHALLAGDPLYALGRVETRSEEEKEEGLDASVAHANLIMRGGKDVGMEAKLHRGTELTMLASLRSTTEAVVVPLIMLTFSAIPFLW